MTETLNAHFIELARNNMWSNHRLHRACARLSAAEYFRKRASFFGSIHAGLAHIVIVDEIYYARIFGEDIPYQDATEDDAFADLESLSKAQAASDRKLLAFCEQLDTDSLSRIVTFTNMENTKNTDPVSRILTHLFVHQIHHRGQVHDMLCATDVPPPQLDEYFLSGDLPRRKSELREIGLL